MKKWVIRLIGISFVFGAILMLIDTITGKSKGFLGFTFTTPYPVDFMAWIGIYLQSYTGYYLLRLDHQGRKWALIILWISAFSSVFGLIILSLKNRVSPLATLSFTSNYVNYTFKSSLLAVLSSALLFYTMQIYFLMRKDVKAEFHQQEIKSDKSEEQTAQ
jgi:uncharacterized protein YacL